MKNSLIISVLAFISACATDAPKPQLASANTTSATDIQVMVVGSFHMGNPGLDVVNAEVESMLTPQRQSELAAVAQALATFQPTVIAVERITDEPEYVDNKFESYSSAMLNEVSDERYQIGYRLAALADVKRIYGVDEQPSEGEPDYFPFGKLVEHANETGQGDALQSEIDSVAEQAELFTEMQKNMSVAELLLTQNVGELASPEIYYRTFRFDRGEAQPGAELQAYWFMRNAKIFSKLAQVTKPGDRVVVVFGAGHKFWLDHFAEQTPGFVSVDSVPYLKKALQ